MRKPTQITGGARDERTRRSRDKLSWALIDLVRERDYEAITVQDVAARAGVGRSTFYAHFRDKDDLFIQHAVAFSHMFGAHLAWDESRQRYVFPLAALLEHVREFRFLYEALNRSRALDRILAMARIVMAETFRDRIAARGGTLPADLLGHHYAATVMTLLTWWMDRHAPCSAQQMEAYFAVLIAGPAT